MKPKVKQLSLHGDVAIWLVDGAYVRKNLDEEFTTRGHHWTYPFIPKKEIWIDEEAHPDEYGYYIDHQLVERRLMTEGKPYAKAEKKADAVEVRERARSEGKSKKRLSKVEGSLIGTTKDGLKVFLIDGTEVRDQDDVEFTEGGHDLVYKYIPKNEIWIDDDVLRWERRIILFHELYEHWLMKNKKLTYDEAHRKASMAEHELRNEKPERLTAALAKLGWTI